MEIPNRVKLGELTKIKTGKLDANAASPNGKYPFFTCSRTPLKIDKYSYDCECVLVAGNGDLNVKYYRGKFDAYQRTYIIQAINSEVFVPYIYFFLDNYLGTLRGLAIGGVIKYIKLGNLTEAEVPLPSLDEQKKIAAILDKATELIALRKQQIEKLDLLVKSRFIEMFGTLPNKDYVFLEEMCVLITDGTHQPPKFVKEGIPFLFVSNIVKNTTTYDTEKYITEENYIELIKRTPVEIGDILFSTVGSYGHPAVVKYDRPFCFQRHIAYLKPKKELVNSEYLHSALLSVDGQRQIEARVKGVAQKTLNLSEIRNIRLPLPSMKQQLSFASFIQKVDKSKSTLQQSLEKLELNYKALMQTYFG